MAFIYMLGLQKGGVAKTTTALHLAFAARDQGQTVLVIDMDTQGSASILLSRDPLIAVRRDIGQGSAEGLFTNPEATKPILLDNGISLLVGSQSLEQLDHSYNEPKKIKELMDMRPRIAALPYDVIIIDTPPAIGVRHVAPILWADAVVAVIEPSGLALAGLATFTRTVEQIKNLIKRPITVFNIVNRYNKSSRKQRELLDQVVAEGRVKMEQPYLSNRVAVADALTEGKPVWEYQGVDSAVKDEWRELMERLLKPATEKAIANVIAAVRAELVG